MRQTLRLLSPLAVASLLALPPATCAAAALDIPAAPLAASAAINLPVESAPFSGYLLRQNSAPSLAGPAFPSGLSPLRPLRISQAAAPDVPASLFGSSATGRMMQTLLAGATRHPPAAARRPLAIAPAVRPVRPIASARIGPHLTVGFVWQR